MLVFNKARSPSHLRRRALAPLTIAVLAGLIEFVAMSLGQIGVREGRKSLTSAAVQRLIGEALGDSTLS